MELLTKIANAAKGFPDCKVVLGLCDIGAFESPNSAQNPERFRSNMQRYNRRLIETFDSGVYHPNVTTVLHGAYIDRVEGYPYVDEPISDIYPDIKSRKYTNMIHPKTEGYKQLGRGMYGKIKAISNGVI